MAGRDDTHRRARWFAERRITSRDYDRPRQSYSASLLESLWNRTPEPDYELARISRGSRSAGSRAAFAVMAVALGLFLSIAVVQLSSTQDAERDMTAFLLEQIESRSAENDALAGDNELRAAERSAVQETVLDPAEVTALEELSAASALAELSGMGTIITMHDYQGGPAADDPFVLPALENSVQDADIQTVVNALFSQGADGVAINGHRLTSLSAVRSAGRAILVDYSPIEPPYRIVAIGPDGLAEDFLSTPASRYVSTLRDEYGIETQISQEETTIPAAQPVRPRFAVPSTQEDPA